MDNGREVTSRSLGSYVLISPDECPTISQLKTAVERLTKDIAVLSQFNSAKWSIEDLNHVMSFLELLMKNEKLISLAGKNNDTQ